MSERFLTVTEVAEILSTPTRTVRRWCASGAIPSVRTVGGHIRVPVETLRDRADLAGYGASRAEEMSGW